MPTITSGDKILVSGANGYIAIWVVRRFLEKGYAVRGTVRSADKGKYLEEYFKSYGDKFELVIVEDITKEGAFDEAVKGVDAIAHTASPFYLDAASVEGTKNLSEKVQTSPMTPIAELNGPAINGTVSILKSALKNGANVKRVVVTSSCASVLEVGVDKVFTEENWNELAIREIKEQGDAAPGPSKYRASKTLAEKGWCIAYRVMESESEENDIQHSNYTLFFIFFFLSMSAPLRRIFGSSFKRGTHRVFSTAIPRSSPKTWRPFVTASAVAGFSVAAYTLGSIYPPSALTILFPRTAPGPPDPASKESQVYTESLEQKLQVLPELEKLRKREDADDWYEVRPYRGYPEERRVNSLTAGALRGQGKLALPPLVLAKKDETESHVFVHLGRGLCGHDGIIHGGLLATLLDETLARTAIANLPEKVGVTALLTLNYRAPTRADQFVVIHTILNEVKGRKATVTGRVEALDGTLLVEASATFVQPKYAKLLNTEALRQAMGEPAHSHAPVHLADGEKIRPCINQSNMITPRQRLWFQETKSNLTVVAFFMHAITGSSRHPHQAVSEDEKSALLTSSPKAHTLPLTTWLDENSKDEPESLFHGGSRSKRRWNWKVFSGSKSSRDSPPARPRTSINPTRETSSWDATFVPNPPLSTVYPITTEDLRIVPSLTYGGGVPSDEVDQRPSPKSSRRKSVAKLSRTLGVPPDDFVPSYSAPPQSTSFSVDADDQELVTTDSRETDESNVQPSPATSRRKSVAKLARTLGVNPGAFVPSDLTKSSDYIKSEAVRTRRKSLSLIISGPSSPRPPSHVHHNSLSRISLSSEDTHHLGLPKNNSDVWGDMRTGSRTSICSTHSAISPIVFSPPTPNSTRPHRPFPWTDNEEEVMPSYLANLEPTLDRSHSMPFDGKARRLLGYDGSLEPHVRSMSATPSMSSSPSLLVNWLDSNPEEASKAQSFVVTHPEYADEYKSWTGQWNQNDMQNVIKALRLLK
ncbi:hypothetical protein H0H93_014299 [Arthromyces matolae]|nr:hypothetical protein H0H93_014299 [Arthromyces matolae]